jgi:hypothetical protein
VCRIAILLELPEDCLCRGPIVSPLRRGKGRAEKGREGKGSNEKPALPRARKPERSEGSGTEPGARKPERSEGSGT